MLARLELLLISVVLILARFEFGSNLNSSYTSHADWNLIIISTVPTLARLEFDYNLNSSYTIQIGI